MIRTLLIATFLFFGTLAYAQPPQNVSVTIDGIQYQCSPNGQPVSTCADWVQSLERQFERCDQFGFADECIKKTYFPAAKASGSCFTVRDACYDQCTKHMTRTQCWDGCYPVN